MNRFMFVAALALSAFASACVTPAQANPLAPVEPAAAELVVTQAQESNVTIALEGMSCQSCVARITNTLSGMTGVLEARVSLEETRAYVRFDAAQVTVEQMLTAIQGIGYGASVAPES